jgi:hypothetical protein
MAKTPRHPGAPPPPHGSGGEGSSRTIRGVVEVNARLPRDLTEEFSASSKETSGRENQRLRLEKWTLGTLLVVALLNLLQAVQSVRSADATVRSAKIADDNLKVSQRPWVFMDVRANSDINYTAEDGMYMNVVFSLKNLGITPAIDAQLGVNVVGDGVDAAVQKTCFDAEGHQSKDHAMREAYFTGMPTDKGWLVTFDPVKEGRSDKHNGTFEPILIGCAAYQSSVDPGVWHHTWKAYLLVKKDTRSPNGAYVQEVGKLVKKDDVLFEPWLHPEGED